MEVKVGALVVVLMDRKPVFGLVKRIIPPEEFKGFIIETERGEIPRAIEDILPLAQTDGSIRIPAGRVETYQADVIYSLALEVFRLREEVSKLKLSVLLI